jgi:hypothetical protein
MPKPVEEPKKSHAELILEAEVARCRARITELEIDVKVRDEQIRHLTKPKLPKLDPEATDKFKRPFRG